MKKKTLVAFTLIMSIVCSAFFIMQIFNSAQALQDSERAGCCSHHGGVCGCSGGHAKCCDGSISPSCGC